MTKILGLMGSPRKNMNTDILLDKVLEGIKVDNRTITKLYLKDLNISPCTGCDTCGRTGVCCINDDMNDIYNLFNESEGIIIGSPLYFNTVSSLTKMVIDRCQVYWSSKYVLKNPSINVDKKRIGMFICTGGAPYRDGHFNAAIPVMDLFFKAINTEYKYNLLVSNTDVIPVWNREDKLKEALSIGNSFFTK